MTVSDTAQFMAEATSLHFDALQSWSGQMLVPAPHWQLALAHAGLLPDANLLCYPKDSLYTRITLQRLVPAPCAGFRLATLSDLPQLLELEAQWDSAFLRSSEATLRQRLELEPSGQFVAFGGDGALLAAMYTQRVASLAVLRKAVRRSDASLHRVVTQLLGVVSLPSAGSLGEVLRSFVLRQAQLAGTRCIDDQALDDEEEAAEQAVAPRSALTLEDVKLVVAEVVDGLSYGAGSAQSAMQTGFMELGLDSVDVVQLIDRLNGRLPSCGLLPMAVFAHPTPAALSAHIFEQLREREAELQPQQATRIATSPVDQAALLSEYQLWPHGYVAVATLRASRRALEVLAVPHSFDALVAATGANAGHLQVALRTLRVLGWVTVSDAGAYAAPAATVAAASCASLASVCDAVYSDAPGMVARLAGQLRLADEGWVGFAADGAAPAALRTMLTGAVLAPLLMELHMHHMETAPGGGVRLRGLDRAALGPLAASFRRRGMCVAGLSDGGLQLTESGRFVVQRCGAFGVALSYRPMLRELETVLFGDVTEVFTHDSAGHEAHVDRTMNVIGSGFMHGKFFDDMMSVHVHRTFDELPLDQQPSIVADTGCGDGTLLLRLYRYVRERTRRGKQLETRPLLMVGVDFNEESLVATAKTLREAGVPFETMFGDIGDPEPIHEGLCSRFGARGKDDILHVRSFLDHDRPYLEPTDGGISASAIEGESDAAYVRPDGGVLTRALTYRSLVEHVSVGPRTQGMRSPSRARAVIPAAPSPSVRCEAVPLSLPVPLFADAALGVCGGPSRPAASGGALVDGVGHGAVHGRGDVAAL